MTTDSLFSPKQVEKIAKKGAIGLDIQAEQNEEKHMTNVRYEIGNPTRKGLSSFNSSITMARCKNSAETNFLLEESCNHNRKNR